MRIDLIVGIRPYFMKISPIIDAIKANPEATHRLGYQINRDTFDAAHHVFMIRC
jgi:UDP-N-acetylglucosamine 2-epimerase